MAGSSGRPSVGKPRRSIAALAFLAFAIVVAVVAAIVLVRALPPKALTKADLAANPAYALRLPGSDELLAIGSEAQQGVEGNVAAYAGHIFGTAATSADVYAFYERELARLGWKPETPPYFRSTVELETRIYCSTGAYLRLAIDDKDRAFQPSLYKGRTYTTVFDATLVAQDPRATCPQPAPTPFRTVRP